MFSLFYYLGGGTDAEGNPYIYDILDWRDPGGAILFSFLAFMGVFIIFPILYGFYHLRLFIYDECACGKDKKQGEDFWINDGPPDKKWVRSIKIDEDDHDNHVTKPGQTGLENPGFNSVE